MKDERFERFIKHRSIVDLQQTLEICTLYEDSATFKIRTLYEDGIKDLSKRLRTHESPRELVRHSEPKRKQAPESEANVCRRRRQMQSRKNLSMIHHFHIDHNTHTFSASPGIRQRPVGYVFARHPFVKHFVL